MAKVFPKNYRRRKKKENGNEGINIWLSFLVCTLIIFFVV